MVVENGDLLLLVTPDRLVWTVRVNRPAPRTQIVLTERVVHRRSVKPAPVLAPKAAPSAQGVRSSRVKSFAVVVSGGQRLIVLSARLAMATRVSMDALIHLDVQVVKSAKVARVSLVAVPALNALEAISAEMVHV